MELDKARSDYQKFSSKKFEIIEETWNAMFEIVKELKIFNKSSGGNYVDYLNESLEIIMKYMTVVRKNSLYFSDEISKLLSEYISLCSESTHYASEQIKSVTTEQEMKVKFTSISEEVYKKATKRDEVLTKIRDKFKKELRVE